MHDPVYMKLRYSELELQLLKKLAVAYRKLDDLYNGEFPTENASPRRNDIWDSARFYSEELSSAQNFAWDIANEMTNDLSDEEWYAIDAIKSGELK